MTFDDFDAYLADLSRRRFVLERLRRVCIVRDWTLADLIRTAALDRSDTAACDYRNARSDAAVARIPVAAMRNLAYRALAYDGDLWALPPHLIHRRIEGQLAFYGDDVLLVRDGLSDEFRPEAHRVRKTLGPLLDAALRRARSVTWVSPFLPAWAMSSRRASAMLTTYSDRERRPRSIKGATAASSRWRDGLLGGYAGKLQLVLSADCLRRWMDSNAVRRLAERLYLELFDHPRRELLLTNERVMQRLLHPMAPSDTTGYTALFDDDLVLRSTSFTAPVELYRRPASGAGRRRWDERRAQLLACVRDARRAPEAAADVISRLVYDAEQSEGRPWRPNRRSA